MGVAKAALWLCLVTVPPVHCMPAPSLRRHTSAFWVPEPSQYLQYEPQTLPSYSSFGTQGGALWIYSHPIGKGEPFSSEPSRTSWDPMSETREATPDSQHSTTSPQGVLCHRRHAHIGNIQFLPHVSLAAPAWKALVDKHFESRNILKADSAFIQQLLPNTRLPVDILTHKERLRELLHKSHIWNRKNDHLKVPSLTSRSSVQHWISLIIDALNVIAHLSSTNENARDYHTNCDCAPPFGYYIDRRPDIIVTDKKPPHQVAYRTWFAIRGVIKYTGDSRATQRLKETEAAKTYILHATQSHRCFSISLSLRTLEGSPHFHIVYADRIGAVRTTDLDIETQGPHNSMILIRILAFLFFGSPEDIGFDPTMSVDEATGEVNFVKFGGRQYDVQATLFSKPSLIGRGTKVWRTTCENVTYVVKDSWVDQHRRGVEHRFLKDIKAYCETKGLDMEDANLPEIYDGGAVMIGDEEDSTERLRGSFGSTQYIRLHERLVLLTVGDDLSTFRSSKELFQVLADAVLGHQFLCENMRILYWDISAKNILICRTPDKVRGILIDLDCAVSMSPESQEHKLQESRPSGTPPFMALALLQGEKKVLHEPKHDLESFVYVLMYMVSAMIAPSKPVTIPPSSPIRQWFSSTNLAEIFSKKCMHILLPHRFLLKFISAYWKPFHKQFNSLCQHAVTPIIPQNDGAKVSVDPILSNTLTHENLTEILQTCRDIIPGDSNPDMPINNGDQTDSDSDSDSDDDRDRNFATRGKRKCPPGTESSSKQNRVDEEFFSKARPMSVTGAPWNVPVAIPSSSRRPRGQNRGDSEFTADFIPVAMYSSNPASTSPTFISSTSSSPIIGYQFLYSNFMEQGPSTSNYAEPGPATSNYTEPGPSTSDYMNQGPSTR